MEELWLARDTDGNIYLYKNKPRKGQSMWIVQGDHIGFFLRLDDESFPKIQWSDEEPTKVKLVIDK